ncbi:MAG TPA: hydantoinase/carbamoylase family amidase [Solirubrobacteraceae bacterium]|nr:hydantoinase/carbamoylase family amidase [Solirubrobacteraceae bacterium]
MSAVELDPQAVIADLDELAAQSGGRFAGAKRLAWTPEWVQARAWLIAKLIGLGLEPERDEAGNLWAPIAGERDEFLIVGSHIDAVPDGGWLDGALGLMTALETVRQLRQSGVRPPIGVRFVDWADEEGARFGRSLVGSSACARNLVADEVRGLQDSGGVTLADGLAACGIDLDGAGAAASRLDGAFAYLELHIEQGPVLLDGARLASAVSGTVGVERHLITFVGQAAHAGSTPMRLRQDSLAAAARAALTIRESAIAHDGVATVGRMHSTPGVITAVAGRTEMQLDQRHLDPGELAAMLAEALEACRSSAQEFQCTLEIRNVFSASPTPFDAALVEMARVSVEQAGGGAHEPIPSGPLHDATEIGRVVPTAMIFAQSDPPISHAAIENSSEPALSVAIDAYGRTVSQVLERAGEIT